jgi:hypothetical protein
LLIPPRNYLDGLPQLSFLILLLPFPALAPHECPCDKLHVDVSRALLDLLRVGANAILDAYSIDFLRVRRTHSGCELLHIRKDLVLNIKGIFNAGFETIIGFIIVDTKSVMMGCVVCVGRSSTQVP